ncbi:MAG: CBS domain-containing protein [bacterium]|nr:MAG: CBS domain-containing protein [bacterium]
MTGDQSHIRGDVSDILVRDVVRKHAQRNLPVVKRDMPIDDLVKAMEWFRHSRILYVVDGENRLIGTITLRALVGHVFHQSHRGGFRPRDLLRVLTTEAAEDLMADFACHAGMDERITDVLERMVDKGVEEIPVLDEDMKVIGDLTMIDLLRAVTKD